MKTVTAWSLSEEEKAEFDRKVQKMMGENQLQGLVQAPPQPENMQMMYGPPVTMNNGGGGIIGCMGITTPIPPAQTGEWIDDTRWRCGCGSENTSKFCPECGQPAPIKPWDCPDCGTHNKGKFCSGCGRPYTKSAE